MRLLKRILISIIGLIVLNSLAIILLNSKINKTEWKHSGGKIYHDWISFDSTFKASGIFIKHSEKTEKIIIFYIGSNLIVADKNFFGWTYYTNKGSH